MQRAHRKLGIGRVDQQRKLDLGSGDGPYVDAALRQGPERLGGDPGVAAHADADHRHFGNVVGPVDPFVADRGPGAGEHGARALVIGGSSLENAIPVTTCCSTISSSSQIRVPAGDPRASPVSGCSKLERTQMRTLCTIPSSTERTCSTLAPSEANSSISSKAIFSSRRALGTTRGSLV